MKLQPRSPISNDIQLQNHKNNQHTYSNPVLIEYNGMEYTYRFTKALHNRRKIQSKTPNTMIPYGFIVAILQSIVRSDNAHKEQIFFAMAGSNERDYAVGIHVHVRNGLLTVVDAIKISLSSYRKHTVSAYKGKRHLYLDDLDLDLYLKQEELRKHVRKLGKKIKKYPDFYNYGKFMYRYKLTKHLDGPRGKSKKKRMTLPEAVIKDVLRFFVKHYRNKLEAYLSDTLIEKKLVLVFQHWEKGYNIGILVSIDKSVENNMLFTVITMIDEEPKDKTSAAYLFPAVPRIVLAEYDLRAGMQQYEEKQRRLKIQKQELLEKRRKESSITVLSKDEAYVSIKKADPILTTPRKIRKVNVEKPISVASDRNDDSCKNEVKQKVTKQTWIDKVRLFIISLFGR